MAHLKSFRTGWENENLAMYLLSRISFVANPISVADDIGSDFLCTLFEPRMLNGKAQLFPLQSFAIQIKSSFDALEATKKIEYLDSLELPFFLGVAQQSDLSLSVFSGEFLPIALTALGRPDRLILRPVEDESVSIRNAYTRDKKQCEVRLPLLTKLGAQDEPGQLASKRERLEKRCTRMHENIATRRAEEYIYKIDDESGVLILAGPGSVKTFRRNHHLRLAEVFYNLEWILDNAPNNFDADEYNVYAEHYASLQRSGVATPQILGKIFEQLRKRLPSDEKSR